MPILPIQCRDLIRCEGKVIDYGTVTRQLGYCPQIALKHDAGTKPKKSQAPKKTASCNFMQEAANGKMTPTGFEQDSVTPYNNNGYMSL